MICGVGRILQFNEAMVCQRVIIKDEDSIDVTSSCRFSWSVDGVCWTKWYNYNDYLNNIINVESDFYLKILFYTSLGDVIVGHSLNKCYSLTLYNPGEFVEDFCENPNLFNPYNNLDCALMLQQQLADSVVCMFGIPIYYFKVNPDKTTADYTFKEYLLHNVVDVKQLKMIIADGQMPSSNYKLSELDFDWESDWETELSKTQYAKAFGDNSFPCNRDFIYVPMMKRMWQVNAAYDEKNEGLMWRSTTWKLSLIKYSDATNVGLDDFAGLVDNFVTNTYGNTFEKIEDNEQYRQYGAAPIDSPKTANTNIFDVRMTDAVRKECSATGIHIDEYIICQNNSIIGRNVYNIDNGGYIGYQKGVCGLDGTLSFILYNIHNYTTWRDVISFGDIKVKIKTTNPTASTNSIMFNNMRYELEKSEMYMVICRWNKANASSDITIYKRKCKTDNPYTGLRPEMYSFDLEKPVFEMSAGYNEDFESNCTKCAALYGPVCLTNIKYYNKTLNYQEAVKESMKYVTKHENCIINDLARPFTSGFGYAVK